MNFSVVKTLKYKTYPGGTCRRLILRGRYSNCLLLYWLFYGMAAPPFPGVSFMGKSSCPKVWPVRQCGQRQSSEFSSNHISSLSNSSPQTRQWTLTGFFGGRPEEAIAFKISISSGIICTSSEPYGRLQTLPLHASNTEPYRFCPRRGIRGTSSCGLRYGQHCYGCTANASKAPLVKHTSTAFDRHRHFPNHQNGISSLTSLFSLLIKPALTSFSV